MPKNEPKRAANHLVPLLTGLPEVYTPLEGCSSKTAGSLKTRTPLQGAQTGPNSCSGLFCGARQREMAITEKFPPPGFARVIIIPPL
ncbi:MAG: hypothetical protein C0612_12520 [Desulfobulbaceae bacterium]|nr:MAG: hypothetical protein C0612_12520 [Desulfobulbaceae bacterium]